MQQERLWRIRGISYCLKGSSHSKLESFMFYNGWFSLLLHGWILNFVQINWAYKSEVLELTTPE